MPDVDTANVPTVAIVGAGFSGTMTAVQLARQSARRAVRIVIIEPSGKFGSGVAYGTRCTRHVLNVPAGNMSALPDTPTDFVEWTRRHGISDSPDAFVPRYWYGVYLHDLLEEARSHAWLDRVAARVVDIVADENGGARVVFDEGEPLRADRVVLAGGNFPPAERQLAGSGLLGSPRYVRDPWRPKALDGIQSGDSVMLVGTGLTMIDVVVQLQSSGHRGTIHALSRRGLLPQPHRKPNTHVALPIPREVLEAPRTALGLLRGVRRAVRRVKDESGHDWRDVISSLRPITIDMWTSLAPEERARFLRHVRPFWDTHRHRIPADVAEEFQRLRADGAFVLHRGRIIGSEAEGSTAVRVRVQSRDGSGEQAVSVGWVVNCTGPDSDVRRVEGSLWARLLASGSVQADPLGLGVVTTPEGVLVNSKGEPSAWLSLIGPLRKAQLWESTAVPELRVQADKLAKRLLEELPLTRPAAPEAAAQTHWDEPEAAVPVYIGEYI